MSIDFTLAGHLLTGVDDFGCEWHTEEATGWFDGPSVRTDTNPRMQQGGDWRGAGFRGGRLMTFSGHVLCPDLEGLENTARRFRALLSSGGFDTIEGTSPVGTLSSLVQLDSAPLFTPLSDRAAEWQLALGSEDPLLYGPATFASTTLAAAASGTGRTWPRVWPRSWGVTAGSTAGTAVAPNAGTSAYWPTLRIRTGVDCLNPVIRLAETGDSLAFDGTIPAGQWIDIDAGSRGVTFGAGMTDVRHLVDVSGLWLAVPIGGATYSLDADSGDSSTVLEVYGYEGAWS